MKNSKDYRQMLRDASLKQRIDYIKSDFVFFVDMVTINYKKSELERQGCKDFEDDEDFRRINLTKKAKADCIDLLQWFKKDIEACIAHLEV